MKQSVTSVRKRQAFGAGMFWPNTRGIRLLCVALVFALCHCSPHRAEIPLTRLSSDFQPLRAQFNHDAGDVRLILLLDPT